MKTLIAFIIVAVLILCAEAYPHFENIAVSAGDQISDATGHEPDTSQVADFKAIIWGVGSMIVVFCFFLEMAGR